MMSEILSSLCVLARALFSFLSERGPDHRVERKI
jgi:hypothetical protein